MFAGGGVNRGDRPQIMGEPHLCIKGGTSAIAGPRISPTIGLKISPEIKHISISPSAIKLKGRQTS